MAEDGQRRFAHLDLLRGAMMSLGVLVHASHADYDLGRYEWVRFLSASFRMAAFFLVSGFFTVPAIGRYGRTYVSRRWVILGVPALVSVLVLNPPVLHWMRAYFSTAPVPATPRMNWHLQIWFLFVLMIYAALVRPALSLLQVARARLGRLSPLAAEALLFSGLLAFCTLGVKAVTKVGPALPGFEAWGFIAGAAVKYLPYFLLGARMYASPEVFRVMHARPLLWGVGAVAALLVRHALGQVEITSAAVHLVVIAWDYFAALACTGALLGAGARIAPPDNRAVRLWAESAYTVYLLHYFFVALSLVQAERLGLSVPLRAALAAAVALAGGIGVHVALIRRVPLAAFLLNGRLPRRTVPA